MKIYCYWDQAGEEGAGDGVFYIGLVLVAFVDVCAGCDDWDN